MTGNELEDVLAQALEALPVSVCISDARLPDSPVVWVNPAFERLTGHAAADVVGRNCRFLQDGLPPQPERHVLRRALAAGERVSVVLDNLRADGSRFANELVVTPLHDDAGSVTHYLALQRDVTAEQDTSARATRLRAEQDEVGRALQANLVPRQLPHAPGLDVAVHFQAAAGADAAVSGDFYDLYAAATDVGAAPTWNAAIGDVAGRGAGAAAYTERVRHLLKGIGLQGGSPAAALELLNAALLDEMGDRFVTVALAQLQVRQDQVRARVALAGHPQPVLVRDGTAELVGRPGDLLGVLPGATATDLDLRLQPGDALVLYTDGVTEAGAAVDQFGDERLLEAAARPAADARQLVENVVDAVDRFDPHADDDSALLAVRVGETG